MFDILIPVKHWGITGNTTMLMLQSIVLGTQK